MEVAKERLVVRINICLRVMNTLDHWRFLTGFTSDEVAGGSSQFESVD